MKTNSEIEIKFRIAAVRTLNQRLKKAGFRLLTPSTHELNTLYDFPGKPLRRRGELLRLRQYGSTWVLTHKSKGKTGRHKARIEHETQIMNGPKMATILAALGLVPTFRYEKFRAEWSDGKGHVVVDHTPVGDFGEIEGSSRWIDRTAATLQIAPADYITHTYTELFFQWKRSNRSPAKEMTFAAIAAPRRPN